MDKINVPTYCLQKSNIYCQNILLKMLNPQQTKEFRTFQNLCNLLLKKFIEIFEKRKSYAPAIKLPDPTGLLGQKPLGIQKKRTPNNCLPHVTTPLSRIFSRI